MTGPLGLNETIDCEFCGNGVIRSRVVTHLNEHHASDLADQRKEVPTVAQEIPAEQPTADNEAAWNAENVGFHLWWQELVNNTAPTIQQKAHEYGSNSLAEMGRMFARAQGRPVIEDAEALEIGCMIYAKGKLERVLDAMLKGRLPSTDTWHDLAVYASMAQYIRETGGWPGPVK